MLFILDIHFLVDGRTWQMITSRNLIMSCFWIAYVECQRWSGSFGCRIRIQCWVMISSTTILMVVQSKGKICSVIFWLQKYTKHCSTLRRIPTLQGEWHMILDHPYLLTNRFAQWKESPSTRLNAISRKFKRIVDDIQTNSIANDGYTWNFYICN